MRETNVPRKLLNFNYQFLNLIADAGINFDGDFKRAGIVFQIPFVDA